MVFPIRPVFRFLHGEAVFVHTVPYLCAVAPLSILPLAFGILGFLLLLWLLRGHFLELLPIQLRTRLRWRIGVRGQVNVPESGAVLLVCQRPQYLDWLPLITSTKRKVHYVVLAGWAQQPEAKRILDSLNSITLAGNKTSTDAREALRQAKDALKRGEAVCIFAETRQFADGVTLTLDDLLKDTLRDVPSDTPILPVAVEHQWGSPWQYTDGKFILATHTRRRPPVWVTIGKPLSCSASGGEIVHATQKSSSETALAWSDKLLPVHREFVRYAAQHPFHPCIVDSLRGDTPLSYGRTLAGAMCLSNLLRTELAGDQHVGIWLPTSLGGALANFALAFLGKTSVNLNYTASAESTQFAIDQCQMRHVITAKRFTKRMPLEVPEGVQVIYLEDLLARVGRWSKLSAFLKVLLLPGWILERMMGLHRHSLEDVAAIIYSSGSTGEPKGVMLTHRNLSADTRSLVGQVGVNPQDRALCTLPFFHSFGYTVTLWMALQIGAMAIYHFDPRQAKDIGQLAKKHGATLYLSTATFLRFCLKKCQPEDFRTIRFIFCGAERLPPSLALDFEKKHGVLPMEGYGTTELAPASTVNLPDQQEEGCLLIRNRIGTVGPLLMGQSAQIVDPETLTPLPLGEEGVVVVHGANVMTGYYQREEQTNEVMLNGGYVTGDVGHLDSFGHLTITGRLSRFAKIGGEMVPVEKIEEQLHCVLETSERVLAVTAVPDERKGERLVVLHLSLNGTPVASLCERLLEHGLPNLWIPSERDFFAVESLPTLGSGKLHLTELYELAIEIVQRGLGSR